VKGLRAIRQRETIAPILSRRTAMVCIIAVNLETGEVIDSMDNVGQVTNWIGRDGGELPDAAGAVVAVAFCGFRWWSIDLREFQTVSVH
jgi:hypothetical protein